MKKGRKDMRTIYAEGDLAMLQEHVELDLTLNDLRMMVNCLKAVEYQARLDDEPYLDEEALELKGRLEATYERTIQDLSGRGDPVEP